MDELTGVMDPRSWEKSTWWKLSNGWIAIEHHTHYGPAITCLLTPDEKQRWEASNGWPGDKHSTGGAAKANALFGGNKYIDLPEFAKDWVDQNEYPRLVRPKFKKVWNP